MHRVWRARNNKFRESFEAENSLLFKFNWVEQVFHFSLLFRLQTSGELESHRLLLTHLGLRWWHFDRRQITWLLLTILFRELRTIDECARNRIGNQKSNIIGASQTFDEFFALSPRDWLRSWIRGRVMIFGDNTVAAEESITDAAENISEIVCGLIANNKSSQIWLGCTESALEAAVIGDDFEDQAWIVELWRNSEKHRN